MVFPKSINIHKKHTFGDKLIDSVVNDVVQLSPIDKNEFDSRKENRAIGGIQIVKGDWCRENGYLKGTRWMTPVGVTKGFLSCKCDVPFRKTVGRSEAVDIPDVYRVRHSVCGRDSGTVDHGEKTKNIK